jgi:hypothetical protein
VDVIVENVEGFPEELPTTQGVPPAPPAPIVTVLGPGFKNNLFPCKGAGPKPEALYPPAPPPPPT